MDAAMTLRTEHPHPLLTPELAALAELIFLIDLLLADRFEQTDDNAATWLAFDEVMASGQQLVRERLAKRRAVAEASSALTAHR
jgi:hypothetical protein